MVRHKINKAKQDILLPGIVWDQKLKMDQQNQQDFGLFGELPLKLDKEINTSSVPKLIGTLNLKTALY